MTKAVRIENADTGAYKVVVKVMDKGAETQVTDGLGGVGTMCAPDTLAQEIVLGHPTAMHEFYITSSRYLIVTEEPLLPPQPTSSTGT